MNWLGVFALILLLNTLLLASILGFFVIHHLTTSTSPSSAAPAATTAAAAASPIDASLLLPDPLAVPVPSCPICSPTTVLQTTTVTESKTTTTVTTTTTVDVESQKLLFKLLDAYLESNRAHLSHHSPYDAPPATSPEIYPGVAEGSAIYEELLKKLKFAEAKLDQSYDSAPPYPGSSAVCSMQLDVEAVSKCATWRNHGYCETHPSTLHLLCKKTCLCRSRRDVRKH